MGFSSEAYRLGTEAHFRLETAVGYWIVMEALMLCTEPSVLVMLSGTE